MVKIKQGQTFIAVHAPTVYGHSNYSHEKYLSPARVWNELRSEEMSLNKWEGRFWSFLMCMYMVIIKAMASIYNDNLLVNN